MIYYIPGILQMIDSNNLDGIVGKTMFFDRKLYYYNSSKINS